MIPLYVDHIKRNFGSELQLLRGKTLACDCGNDELCEADNLAGLGFEAIIVLMQALRVTSVAGSSLLTWIQ